jgi:hypothetical protein
MSPDSILVKTDKGAEEIATRKYKLDAKLRTLLIMVNGASSAAQLAQKFAGIGDIQPLLVQLEKEGYVREGAAPDAGAAAAGPAADIKAVRLALARAVTDVLGPGGDSIALKIEECATMDALRAYLDSKREMLNSVLGRKAPDFWKKAESLIRA